MLKVELRATLRPEIYKWGKQIQPSKQNTLKIKG
jgi:hypothetical protein